MIRVRFLLGMLVAVALIGGSLYGQDTKAKVKLPQGWGKLGLSEEQRKQVASINAKYDPQIAELTQKLEDLRKQRRTELEKVLTADQRARVREALLKKAPAEDTKETTKKDKDR